MRKELKNPKSDFSMGHVVLMIQNLPLVKLEYLVVQVEYAMVDSHLCVFAKLYLFLSS